MAIWVRLVESNPGFFYLFRGPPAPPVFPEAYLITKLIRVSDKDACKVGLEMDWLIFQFHNLAKLL